ncbi:hypothetical protein [Dethiosulfatarculus sandiegensis]|uniref:hypothetical protein n=1 Tax=Dethiosulfatarculus sandiegensis TaxID=1429043 RepID=UPI0012E2569C|nr:hypothetical protein [Dethiosulfatarculus sandiegensis]
MVLFRQHAKLIKKILFSNIWHVLCFKDRHQARPDPYFPFSLSRRRQVLPKPGVFFFTTPGFRLFPAGPNDQLKSPLSNSSCLKGLGSKLLKKQTTV